MAGNTKTKTVISIKILAVVLFLILLCALGHWIYKEYAQTSDSASYIDKLNRLESIEEQKVVFIGGSATHFGVRAELFQQLTGIQSVNMGLNAGISVGLYLDSIEPFLRAGDIVFITPEYSYFGGSLYNYAEADAEFLLYYAYGTFPQMNCFGYLKMLQPTLYSGWKNAGAYIQDNLRDRLKKGDTLYLRSNSNAYGDMEGAKGWPQSDIAPVKTDAQLGTFLDDMVSRIKKLEEQGIFVYICYPPYQEASYHISTSYISLIHETMKNADVTLLYEPETSALPNDMFLDTVYHLTYEGATEFTQMLAHQFKKLQVETI